MTIKTFYSCTVPPKGQSNGFKQRNRIVGNAWTSYSEEEKDIFYPRLFENLIQALVKDGDPIITPALTASDQTEPTEATTDALTEAEKNQYLPIFNRLVNKKSVARDFKHGRLCRHSRKGHQLEKVGIDEIKKLVEQLHIINSKFHFHFHLLVAAWNPNTSQTRALYQEEFTSCERWAVHARKELHLLERFAVECTQAPPKSQKNAKQAEYSKHQASLRKELNTSLNDLIHAHLPGGHQIKSDAHPQGPNPHLILQGRKF
ncbi:uncharacterized protein MELLADRAFT_95386 [Melampsora larici-populina 98AG31]|uniref:Uncharacterized protein n=1 Tax=Melampsora larici-populina (strain 98AG31 / pathotype 3-4-7) TaxID=747676 RepID=F4S948_MELLP|nr:uncharacterized protein MELLADRAFT_95386 [Melampsora larici-populina 98AG31]EGF98828.1 hypothetical protein MELLADRAFT_95386 [Melampsora larici-populina 98AG31]